MEGRSRRRGKRKSGNGEGEIGKDKKIGGKKGREEER